jgi:hypothetical protein
LNPRGNRTSLPEKGGIRTARLCEPRRDHFRSLALVRAASVHWH